MPELLTFAQTLPQLVSYSAEACFQGTFLAICRIKNWSLTAFQQKIFQAQIAQPAQIEDIASFVVAAYREVLEDHD